MKNHQPWYETNDAGFFLPGQYFIEKYDQPIKYNASISGWDFDPEKLKQWLIENDFELLHHQDFYHSNSKCSEEAYIKEFKVETPSNGIGWGVVVVKLDPLNLVKFKKMLDEDDDYFTKPNVSIYGVGDKIHYDKIFNYIESILKKRNHRENNISLVVKNAHGYDTEYFKMPKQQLDLSLNYGEGFMPIHDKILKNLNQQNGKGLVLLHGEPGTGKTHYLKYLASKIKDKKVMFVAPYMVDFITSPEMTPFLIENANSVLFIEDAERVITDRNLDGNAGVSNILNLTDGILGDILNIQIVATFNMDHKKLDEALLRKGRLIAEHHFDKLSVKDANTLIKKLGYKVIVDQPMTLTEIYNLTEVEYKTQRKGKSIGFN
jgi:energy-coupling factor transporter ATP-binding protein EcfA2